MVLPTTCRQCAALVHWTTNHSESPSTALRAPSPPVGEKDGMRGSGSWKAPGCGSGGSSHPACAVLSLHKLRSRGFVRCAHVWPIPFQLAADPGAQRDAAKQDDLCEIRRDVEVRVSCRAALHRREPFLVV